MQSIHGFLAIVMKLYFKIFLMMWLASTSISLADSSMPQPPRAVKGDQCVEPTDDMRRNHMNYLTHQRDLTVHQGIRTKKHSLVECLECHTQSDDQGKHIPINAEGEFCQACHAYSSVSMDCFQCHATKPRATTASASQTQE